MDATGIYTIFSEMIKAVLYASGPILILAVSIGLAIAFFQALTQIQEMTLTFVPKIIAIFVGLLVWTPFMYKVLKNLSDQTFDLITNGAL
ncbi:MAG: flagellar biosynthetic protein FliQ [Rhodobacteraceae bacterium]|nr:MAG: flagellar biosynthetic protein FliQ [Paracoccaceae bacterium]